jgi:hypothetical protein
MISTPEQPKPNDTTVRERQLSELIRRIARAREATAHGTTQREAIIRRYGLAHPRSIAASQRLVHAQTAHRRLTNMYSRSASELGRMKAHDHVRTATYQRLSSSN